MGFISQKKKKLKKKRKSLHPQKQNKKHIETHQTKATLANLNRVERMRVHQVTHPSSSDVTCQPHPALNLFSQTWMFNSSLQVSRRKPSVHCVQKQSKIPRHCHVYTHSACGVSTNTQDMQRESQKRRSNVQFVRLAFRSLRETRLAAAFPHLFISTDWWISSL